MNDFITILLPFFVLLGTIILCLLLEAFNIGKRLHGPITLIGTFIALLTIILDTSSGVIYVFANPNDIFDVSTSPGLLVIDDFYRFFAIVFLIVLMLVTLSSIDFISSERNIGVYYSLLIFSTIGMMTIAAANDLLIIFVAWELGSLPAYSLAAFQKSRAETSESALKFFLIGAMSSAFILFGISLVYGISAETNLQSIILAFSDLSSYTPLHIVALMFLFVGFGYKMAAVPFHAWAVDVYQGTPTTITSFLAAGSKAMGFAAVLRIIIFAFGEIEGGWGVVFAILAVVTMTLGNLAALVQENIKRMLAYSSIAHAGYMLIGLASINPLDRVASDFAIAATELHILTHAVMKLLAFTAVIIVAFSLKSENISEYAGLRKKHPWIAFGLTISLLSLMGVPPLAGFISKLLLFFAAIYANMAWLAVIGIINSAISIFYYLRVIKLMLIDKPLEEDEEATIVSVDRFTPYSVPISYQVALMSGIILIILIGILPGFFIDYALSAAQSLI